MKYKTFDYKFLLLITVLVLLSLGTYSAKSEDTEVILQKIKTLQNDIKTLEKAVYSEQISTNNVNTELSGEAGDVLTKHLLKLSELEEQFKNLTNNFEEINFKLDKLSNRITKIQTDNQMRFQDIEQSEMQSNKSTLDEEQEKLPGSSEPQDLGSTSVNVVSADEEQKTQSIESVGSVISEEAERVEKILPEGSPEKQYEFAISFLKVGDYETAEYALHEFIGIHPKHKLAGNAPATQLEFWHTLADRPVTSNDEAFHGLILFIDGEDNNKDYAARVEQLSARQMLPSGFDEPGEEAVKRGTVAVAFTRVLGVTGGVSMQWFGPTPRYAARELQYMRLFPQGSPHQTFSGREFRPAPP